MVINPSVQRFELHPKSGKALPASRCQNEFTNPLTASETRRTLAGRNDNGATKELWRSNTYCLICQTTASGGRLGSARASRAATDASSVTLLKEISARARKSAREARALSELQSVDARQFQPNKGASFQKFELTTTCLIYKTQAG
jgi:hypothetical protein